MTVATSTQLQATRTHAVNVIEFDSFYVIIWTIQSLNKLRLIVARLTLQMLMICASFSLLMQFSEHCLNTLLPPKNIADYQQLEIVKPVTLYLNAALMFLNVHLLIGVFLHYGLSHYHCNVMFPSVVFQGVYNSWKSWKSPGI